MKFTFYFHGPGCAEVEKLETSTHLNMHPTTTTFNSLWHAFSLGDHALLADLAMLLFPRAHLPHHIFIFLIFAG